VLSLEYTFIIQYYAIDSVKREYFCRPCCYSIVFGRLKYIPRLFSEYMLTFMVEQPMNKKKIKIKDAKYLVFLIFLHMN
jgi:hypothetical protein